MKNVTSTTILRIRWMRKAKRSGVLQMTSTISFPFSFNLIFSFLERITSWIGSKILVSFSPQDISIIIYNRSNFHLISYSEPHCSLGLMRGFTYWFIKIFRIFSTAHCGSTFNFSPPCVKHSFSLFFSSKNFGTIVFQVNVWNSVIPSFLT